MKGFFLLTFCLVVGCSVCAQPKVEWEAVYGELYDAEFRSMVVRAGGFFVVGNIGGWRNEKPYVVLIDGEGNKVWEKTYTDWEGPIFSAVTSGDGGVVMAGITWSGEFSEGAHILRIDSNGIVVWDKVFGASRVVPSQVSVQEGVSCIAKSSMGGFGIAGLGFFDKPLEQEKYLIYLDYSGNMVWNRTFGPPEAHTDFGLAAHSDGGFVMVCGRQIYRINHNGDIVWEKTFGKSNRDSLNEIIESGDGGYIVVGYKDIGRRAYLLKINEDGDKIWEEEYGDPNTEAISIAPAQDSGFLVQANRRNQIYLIRIDAEGEKIWDLLLGDGEGSLSGFSVALAPDGGHIISGSIFPGQPGTGLDVYALKLEGSPFKTIRLTPSHVIPGIDDETLLEAETRTPMPGWGYVVNIWVNLTHLGLPDMVSIYDDGTHGDSKNNDGIYSRTIDIDRGLGSKRAPITVHLVDSEQREGEARTYLYILPPSDEIIYDEGSEEWSPIPSKATTGKTSTFHYSGESSMYVSSTGGSSIDFIPLGDIAFDTYGYQSIDLGINPGESTRFYPRLVVEVLGDEGTKQIDLTSQGYSFPTNNWTHISIPLTDIDAVNRHITSVRLSGVIEGTFYIDNLRIKTKIPETGQKFFKIMGVLIFCLRFLSDGNIIN
jgi:hypothetical protein